ncbi:PREDICTED: putative uncharacterized protein CXorf30 homolog [Elephantulus edwardii]|uniref:putative uncharacterized protein CXorf30 homolog n=1 Tax=Elephantulus edwardii TaxID=28737 RepID=UPI0003F08AD5|nr:PREDICTED: putative uncharacterized protein CXorf30 homolog [Elephantulus edwardii]
MLFELPLSNPKNIAMYLDVQLTSDALSGPKRITINPLQNFSYLVTYCPAATGYREESIIFQPEDALEFWYLLKITTKLPNPVVMREITCELGEKTTQIISFINPTYETLELETTTNSNPINFFFDCKNPPPWKVNPYSTTELAVYFKPTAIGRQDQQAIISFRCVQFKEWKYVLSGIGLFPQPLRKIRVSAALHMPSSLIISLKNPTKEDVIVNISLTNQEPLKELVLDESWDSYLIAHLAFKFDFPRRTKGIALPPKGMIEFPVVFAPKEMKLYNTFLVIQMLRANGEMWPVDNFYELNEETKRMVKICSGEVKAIHWIQPFAGFAHMISKTAKVITCQAKKQVKEKVEVILTGDFFGPNPTPGMAKFIVMKKMDKKNEFYKKISEKIRKFEYEIEYESNKMKSSLKSFVTIYLKKLSCKIKKNQIKLVFMLLFKPMKPVRSEVMLKINSIKDGMWKYPLILHATEPEVDGIINIPGAGLFKKSISPVRLINLKRNTEPFTAYFLPGSDPEFSVNPEVGKVPPLTSDGTLVNVGFMPQMYGKKYKAMLVIETVELYWKFEINGLPETPLSLENVQARIDASNDKFENRLIISTMLSKKKKI